MIICPDTQPLIEQMQLWDKRSGKYIPFVLWPRQVEWLDLLHEAKRIASYKKRQVGFSQLTGADSLAQCMILENFMVLILSKTGDDALEFMKRIHDMYFSLPLSIRLANPLDHHGKPPVDQLCFKTNSRILSVSALRGAGFTGDRVIIDESAHINKKNSKIELSEVMKNVEPVVDKADGQIILITTANGLGDHHKYYKKGERKEGSWRSFFFSCYDDPTFSEEKRKLIVADQGEDHANQNYPRNAREAVISSGRPRFNMKLLDIIESTTVKDPIAVGYLQEFKQGDKMKVTFIPDPKGWVKIWEHPRKDSGYIQGVDTAEGLERDGISDDKQKSDMSTSEVFAQKDFRQVAEITCRLAPDVFAREVVKMKRYYNNAFTGIERNKDGLGCILFCFEYDVDRTNYFYREELDEETHSNSRTYGWRTDKNTKPWMIGSLDKRIRESTITICSRTLHSEATTYIRLPNGGTEAQSGSHDDHVMASAIASAISDVAPEFEPEEKRGDYKEDYTTESELVPENYEGY